MFGVCRGVLCCRAQEWCCAEEESTDHDLLPVAEYDHIVVVLSARPCALKRITDYELDRSGRSHIVTTS